MFSLIPAIAKYATDGEAGYVGAGDCGLIATDDFHKIAPDLSCLQEYVIIGTEGAGGLDMLTNYTFCLSDATLCRSMII